jgi:hypothetical protein
MQTHYSVLEVPESATKEQIKQSYRTLLQVWHPDRFQHNPTLRLKAEEKSKHINAAFDVLSDPVRRRQYDDRLERELRHGQPRTTGSRSSEPLTTRCPNPACGAILRVQARMVGRVICPTCRTSFLYDPLRNEKWDVQYPQSTTTAPDADAADGTASKTEPGTPAPQQAFAKTGILIAVFAVGGVIVVGGISFLIRQWTDPWNRSVMASVRYPQEDNRPPSEAKVRPEANRPTAVPPQHKPTEGKEAETGYLGFQQENGEDLIKPILSPGEGELTVVNDTEWDAAVKLYEEAKTGDTLYRYWYVQSGRRVTLRGLGPCHCTLYFALGANWDPERKVFLEEQRFWKHDKPMTYLVPEATEKAGWERYWVRIIDGQMGIESASIIDQETFNDLF